MSESWRREIPVRKVTETVAAIEKQIEVAVAAMVPVSMAEVLARQSKPSEPLSEAERDQWKDKRLAAMAAVKMLGSPKGEGYTWHDRCSIRNDNKLRCIYVKGHDYPCRFDVGTGG